MRIDRLSFCLCFLIIFSLLPIFYLYFKLPTTHVSLVVSNIKDHLPSKYNSTRRNATSRVEKHESVAQPAVAGPCEISPGDRQNFPNCLAKIEWLQDHWQEYKCFSQHGVNGSLCSNRNYLSQIEFHCPSIGEKSPFEHFEPNIRIDELLDRMTDNVDNYVFIKRRITTLWPTWLKALAEIKKKYPRQFNNYRKLNIIVHLGFLMKESKLNFATKSNAGGPLGELVQWSDLIAALHILGHKLYITTEKNALMDNIKIFSSSEPCPGPHHLDLIVTDILGFLRAFRKQRSFASQNSCKFRIVDSFGTHAEFNNKQFFLKTRRLIGGSLKNPWGGHGLRLKQYWTFYPHTSDNTFLGFVVEEDNVPALFPRESKKAILIYGKEQYMWQNMSDVIYTLAESYEVHATVADASSSKNPIFNSVINHGFLKQSELSGLLKSVVAFIGLGFPLEGPAPLEAIASGAAFVNPRFDPPQYRANTPFLKEKPTLRRWTSQVPYLESVGEPYVYTVDIRDENELMKVMDRIRNPFVPLDFSALGMLLRVNQMLLDQDLCVALSRYPPPSELKIKTGFASCDSVCSNDHLVCEPIFFPLINTEVNLARYTSCNNFVDEESVIAPYDCVLQKNENLFSCASFSTEKKMRVCPCMEPHPDYKYFCKNCL